MHLIGSHGLVYVQVPRVVSNSTFSYNGMDFIPPAPALRFRGLRDVVREITIENQGKKSCWVPQPSPCWLSPVFPSHLSGRYLFFHIPFLTNLPVEALLVLHIRCQIQLQLLVSFPHPIPTHVGCVSIFFPGHMSLVPLLVHLLVTL